MFRFRSILPPLLPVVLAVVALGSTACPKNVPPPDDALESPAKLRAAIEARLSEFDNARFKEVVTDTFRDGERIKVRQLILVDLPDKIRVQTRVPGSNEIVSLLVSDGETFALHRRDNNEYLHGPPTPANINRLLQVDLSGPDVVRVLLGGAPWDRFDREPGEPQLRWNRKRGRYEYSVETRSGGRLVLFARHRPYIVESVVEYGPNGDPVYRYETDDWTRFGDRSLPSYRRFVWPARDLDFSIDVGETEFDVTIPNSLFQLDPPAGSDVYRVDEDGKVREAPSRKGTD